ncbi:MAG TPA: CpaF family protein [Clostridiales bacterium]|nr:CpaF family protein [Clostridiales bacterium]
MSNTGLPSLSNLDSTKQTEKDLNTQELTRKAYRQFELDQKNRSGIHRRTDSPVITFGMLEIAPKCFFEELKPLIKEVSAEIINSISASEATIHISNHKKDPTNVALKETILYIVMSEFNKIDRTNNDVKILRPIDKDILLAAVINEVIGLGPIEPLWVEKKVTEIICNGPKDIQVEIDGKIRKVVSVSFRDKEHLKALIDKLYSSINKQLSPLIPRERGRLHDNSRMYAVHDVIAPQGPNFNIRKHSEDYWAPIDIVNKGTASPELMEDIGNLIHAGVSFLVIGGTGTGKTTLLNALTGFFPENHRIVTIEENLEMKPHPKKLLAAPMECLPAKAGEGREFGVNVRDLVRSSLQMRPDIILVGEVSDGAAYDLCQALNTGHGGGSTVHANDSQDSLNRLRSLVSQEEFVRGPAVLDLIGSAFDIIIVVDRMSDGTRKITEVAELGRTPILAENKELTLEIIPLWDFKYEKANVNGEMKLKATWKKIKELSEYRQKKHRLNLVKRLSWDELLEISNTDSE